MFSFDPLKFKCQVRPVVISRGLFGGSISLASKAVSFGAFRGRSGLVSLNSTLVSSLSTSFFSTSALAQGGLGAAPLSTDIDKELSLVIHQIDDFRASFKKTEVQIDAVSAEIVTLSAELAKPGLDDKRVDYLQGKEASLRRKEEQLRREKEQLRREKEILLAKEQSLRADLRRLRETSSALPERVPGSLSILSTPKIGMF